MPKWGLTVEQRDSTPWGLPAELLEPGKTITDPVQGDIFLTRLECQLVDSPPMQRLRRVRQLGATHLVYPGASHSRLSHSLGALRASQDILDLVVDQGSGPDSVADIFSDWRADDKTYHRKVAEVTVLVRLGALLHDLCHVPFGHSIEDDLHILLPHDENTRRFELLWNQFRPDLRDVLQKEGLATALRPLILSKEKGGGLPLSDPRRREYAFVADIVGNTICADLLDYLERDHYFTGLPARLGRRFLSGFYVTGMRHPYVPGRMVMRIARDGRERDDVTSELFKYLRYRYELSERALDHHAKLAADAMIGKMIEMWRDALWAEAAAHRFPKDVKLPELNIDALRARLARQHSSEDIAAIDDAVHDRLEQEFVRRGDDGLLEHILDVSEVASKTDKRMGAIAYLTESLLNRRLFKLAARCRSARPMADMIHGRFGTPEARRGLELEVTRFAGVPHRQVVLWIPRPSMRMKAAQVLVDDGHTVSTLYNLDHTLRDRGHEIYESHEALWAISAFVDPELKQDDEKRRVVLSRLAAKLNIKWDGVAYEKIEEIAGKKVAKEKNVSHDVEQLLTAQHAAYAGSGETYEEVVAQKRAMLAGLENPTSQPSGAQESLPLISPRPKTTGQKPPTE